MESLVTAVVDMYPKVFRRGYRRELLILALSATSYFLGLVMLTEVSDSHTGKWHGQSNTRGKCLGFGGASGKEPPCQCRRHKRRKFDAWVRKIPWRRTWQPTPVFLPGEPHGQRSLADYSP